MANNQTSEQTTEHSATERAAASATSQGEVFEIPVLPLQDTTLFPGTVVPLAVGRPRSVAAVEAALGTEEKLLACITSRNEVTGDAASTDLYEVGTLVIVRRMMRAEEGMQLIVQGTERIRVESWVKEDPYLRARVRILPPLETKDAEAVEALKRNMQALIQQALALLPQVPPEVRGVILGAQSGVQLAYFLGSILNLGTAQE